MMQEFLTPIVMGALDRWRGDAAHIVSRFAEKVLYGLATAVAALGTDVIQPLALLFPVAMVIATSPGWGEPLGALLDRKPMNPDRLEWWQHGKLLETNALAAMIARGLLWAAPFTPLVYFDIDLIAVPLAFAIAVPLAPYLFRSWEIQEFARGGIAGLIIINYA